MDTTLKSPRTKRYAAILDFLRRRRRPAVPGVGHQQFQADASGPAIPYPPEQIDQLPPDVLKSLADLVNQRLQGSKGAI